MIRIDAILRLKNGIGLGLAALALVAGIREFRHHSLRELRDQARDAYHQIKTETPFRSSVTGITPERADEPLVVYTDTLAKGWSDWSWAKHDLKSVTHTRLGAHAIEMTPGGFQGVYLHHSAFDTGGYGSLELWLYADAPDQARLKVALANPDERTFGPAYTLAPLAAGWTQVDVSFARLGITSAAGGRISGVVIQNAINAPGPTVSIDGIRLMPDMSLAPAPIAATVPVTVDPDRDQHAISPLIYGVAHLGGADTKAWHIGSNRWGGNPNSRYNWKTNSWNAARDWQFRNYGTKGKATTPGSVADAFVSANQAAGVPTLLTIPTIGWVASDGDNHHRSTHVPNDGGPPLSGATSGAITGYSPDENRAQTSVRSVARARDAGPGDIAQDDWVRHLVQMHGDAAHGGVAIYAMDNEPGLWSRTHTDIHPARVGYDDILANFLEYGTAVKDVDPTAQISGPVSWGWTDYMYSDLDRGSDNFHTHADRSAHGDIPFLPWFLSAVREHDRKAGRRTLDILDVHYYPQSTGIYSTAADPATRARRLRSTRSLWDVSYVDESWIGQPVRLLPRLKEWVAANYPGTKIGVTEWNFGAQDDISGGLAIADVLGIFGEQGIYDANYWVHPRKDSPGYLAFELFRNADGQGHGFGDISCSATSADRGRLSCFAARDSKTGDLTLILVNKMPRATITAPITLHHSSSRSRPVAYRFSPGMTALSSETLEPVSGNVYTVTLPPYSATLLRFPKGASQ